MPDQWKRIRDNKMRWHGDIDYDKRIIRINPSKKKNKKPGELLDTILHEEMHRAHPKMWEKTVQQRVNTLKRSMPPSKKHKLYSKYYG